ncbi:MAG: hypothetical protein IT423_16115, partial [Pirellulaceae bacterium]|nr:hypothetical protein [Pirellulaceae bacterium]
MLPNAPAFCLLLICIQVEASDGDSADSNQGDKQAKQKEPAQSRQSFAAKDLEQLKTSGWQRSRYRDRTDQTSLADADLTKKLQPKLAEFHSVIGPILKQACGDCHGASQQEGNIRVDTLDPNLH